MKTKNVINIVKAVNNSTDVILDRKDKLNDILEGDYFDDIDELDDNNFEQHRAKITEHIGVLIAELKNLYNIVKTEAQ